MIFARAYTLAISYAMLFVALCLIAYRVMPV